MFNRISWPTVIAHIDCNSFFASVEQAYNPQLKGKPVLVAGMGGGCVITASYEARAFGIKIGTTIWDAKKMCPQAIIIPANFKHYLLYNRNLMGIIGKFTPDIEPASIDECYIDLKGLRRLYRKPYQEICWDIKEEIKRKLGITVSIGLSTTKVLAKTASNFKKPDGLTIVSNKEIDTFLQKISLDQIKGLGTNTRALLNKQGIYTPTEFIQASPLLIKTILGKLGIEMQMELKGYSARPVTTQTKAPKSLARTRSFKVTTDRQFIYQQLLKNLTIAFWHLRRQNLKTSTVTLMLRTQDYKTYGQEIKLPEELSSETAILKNFQEAFKKLYHPNTNYRSSGVITTSLIQEIEIAPKLFENELETNQQISLFQKIDQITEKHGKQSITLGTITQYQKTTENLSSLYIPFIGQTIN